MGTQPLLLIGTKKGVFLARGDAARRTWRIDGPHCSGTWAFNAVCQDARTGTLYGGGMSNWYGPAVWRSEDGGRTWTHSAVGMSFGDDGPPVEHIWTLLPAVGALYAGVDPAGLFRSEDGGRTWAELPALRAHPSSSAWSPTNGGLPLHAIVPHPQDAQQMWVSVSAGGVYRTADGGRSWQPCAADDARLDPRLHALAASPAAPETLYRQSVNGIFRSDDGGASWSDASAGLPSRFGFPLAVHPRDPRTVYAVPLESGTAGRRYVAGGRAAVWRTRDAGQGWHALTHGLPEGQVYMTVLRAALVVDDSDPVGVFFGTPTGQLYGSVDEGDTWFEVARGLPPIYALAAGATSASE